MKTITDGFQIKRVSNEVAETVVSAKDSKWRYAPKAVWKSEVRNKLRRTE